MRTTLTLDDDVALLVDEARARRGLSFKEIVNEALRLGLEELARPARARAKYRTPSTSLGQCRLPDLDDISAALAAAEGEGFR
jgi:hypothetical protein